jgi:hypothetical protein
MNFKKQAEKLEKILEEEFNKKVPLLVVNKNCLLYKHYKIKKNVLENWDLQDQSGRIIETFKLKVNAALAAKFYDRNQIEKFNEVKNLDTKYWTNIIDSLIFREKCNKTKDMIKKDIYISRWDITKTRAEQYKLEISKLFSYNFG